MEELWSVFWVHRSAVVCLGGECLVFLVFCLVNGLDVWFVCFPLKRLEVAFSLAFLCSFSLGLS